MELKYEGEFPLKSESDFKKLLDPEVVGKAFPGVQRITKEGDAYRAKASLGLGALRGTFDVKFRYSEVGDDRATVVGVASGMQSTVDFVIKFVREGLKVRWSFLGNARGLISAMGKPIVDSAARSMVEQVTRNLQSLL